MAKRIAAGLAGASALLTGIAPLLGWDAKAKKFCNLHFAFTQLFGEIESLMASIRRADAVTAENIGVSKLLHDMFIRIEGLDETKPKDRLIKKLDAKVLEAFPDDYPWTQF